MGGNPAISGWNILEVPRADYATKIESRSPVVKYQNKGQAKNAIHYHFRDYKDTYRNITLYKFDNRLNVYVPIFDSSSELAYAVVDGHVTLKEALESLNWNV